MKTIKNKKGFTLAEFLIIVTFMGFLSTFISLSTAKATASARATNIIHGLLNCKRAVLEWYSDKPEELYYNNMLHGTNNIKANNPEGAYLTETFSHITKEDGKKVALLFIKYDSPDIKFNSNVSRSLAQYAKTFGLYKTIDNLSEENLIAGDEIKTPFYMFVQEIPVK